VFSSTSLLGFGFSGRRGKRGAFSAGFKALWRWEPGGAMPWDVRGSGHGEAMFVKGGKLRAYLVGT